MRSLKLLVRKTSEEFEAKMGGLLMGRTGGRGRGWVKGRRWVIERV